MMGVFVEVDSPGHKFLRGYVIQENGCWEWVGLRMPSPNDSNGYGIWRGRPAHRVMYEQAKGSIPAGLVIDHLCQFKSCVNPDHLEAVTPLENHRRVPREAWNKWHIQRKAEGWIPYAEAMRLLYPKKKRQVEADVSKAKQKGRI